MSPIKVNDPGSDPLIFSGLTAGSEIPGGDFTGSVHSVFSAACNLRSDEPEHHLVTLLPAAAANTPAGIRVDQYDAFPVSYTHLRAHET